MMKQSTILSGQAKRVENGHDSAFRDLHHALGIIRDALTEQTQPTSHRLTKASYSMMDDLEQGRAALDGTVTPEDAQEFKDVMSHLSDDYDHYAHVCSRFGVGGH
jgi:DNA-binding ferritin-like protein